MAHALLRAVPYRFRTLGQVFLLGANYYGNVGSDTRSALGRHPARIVFIAASLTLGLLILIAGGALLWLDVYVKAHAPERVIKPQGALLARDAEGLRRLNELYAMPKTCTESNMRRAQTLEALAICGVLAKPPVEIGNLGSLIYLPPGTKAVGTERRFVFPGGRLANPYATKSYNTYDLARDGAVAVEHIQVQLQNRGVDGWVVAEQLYHVCCAMP